MRFLSTGPHYTFIIWLLLLSAFTACREQPTLITLPSPIAVDAEPTATIIPQATVSAVSDQVTASSGFTETASSLSLPPVVTPPAAPSWPAPQAPLGPFDPLPLTEAEVKAALRLDEAIVPERDDLRLAREYRGIIKPSISPAATDPPSLGDRVSYNVLNHDSNTVVPITATLVGVSDHAYFWFDDAYNQPGRQALDPVESAFDQIYERVVTAFGPPENPGIDGDPRLHILHASPAALCNDQERCGLAGYFSAYDALPRAVSAESNERDMFVMNADKFGTSFYLNVLAHEFRHMIEDNYDSADADWEVEGSATLAEELAGFSTSAHERGNAFLAEPDQQLNRWSDGNTYTYYGQGYLLNRYLYDRFGPELYRDFATHEADGLQAVTEVAAANELAFTGHTVWQDWLAALALHAHPEASSHYRLGDGSLDTVAMTPVTDFPNSVNTTVNQYAADYYHLQSNRPLTVTFEGSRRVSSLDTAPPSGSHFWYANRANYSDVRLARRVDLRPVISATLVYSVWHDIEYGYDFAYLSASNDGGETWFPLVAEHMQGKLDADNPAGKALADHFYTGKSEEWITEQIDLSSFAGQEIWLRFSYVTDPILTFGGLALDNISIPEIGFYDSAETDAGGWQAEGFTRATGTLPQEWHLQLLTFPQGVPVVTPLSLDENRSLVHSVALNEGAPEAILIVGASAPRTLEPAHYRLQVESSKRSHAN